MAKRFKLKFSIPSFQMCRSKDLSSFPGNPVPAIYRLSPVNPKAHEYIGYPNSPSTPNEMLFDTEKKLKPRGRKSTSSVPSRRSHDFPTDNKVNNTHDEEESETLISCMTSFSDEFYHDEMVKYSPTHRRKISSVKKVQRLRFHTLENRSTGGSETGQVKMSSKASMTHRSLERGVKESFAVVKKMKDPYEDFKKSMLEMIMEMEMFEAEDLEQLLQCFLALNSRRYHEVIVRAFMEIWQQMFTWNPADVSRKNLQTDVRIALLEE